MSIAGVGMSQAAPTNVVGLGNENVSNSLEAPVKKKDNSKLLYGSLAALAVIGVGCVAYKAFKGKKPTEVETDKALDNLMNILEYKPEPVSQEVKDKGDELVKVVKDAFDKVKKDAEELESVPEYIRRPLMSKVDIPSTPSNSSAQIEEVVQQFGSFKKGLAYDTEGKLFNGTRELVGFQNRKMETTYKNGKVVGRIYYPTENYDLLEVNRLYDESVEGVKMVDTGLVKRNLNHSVKFEVIEKDKKFPEAIERVIPKAQFDKPFDATFYSQFPTEVNDVAISWKVNDDIRVFGTGLSERGPRKMSLHYKGSHVRDFIDTPLGNIKGFRNSKAQLSIHTNLQHPELKVRSLSELGIVSYKGRTLDDFAAYLTKRYRPDQVLK